VPVPEVATVDPDNDRFPQHRRLLANGGTVIAQARFAGAEVGVLPDGNLVQMLADSFRIGRAGDRQDVPEQSSGHAEGYQRALPALQIKQLRGGAVSKQHGERAKGLAVRWVAPTAVKAWAC
jgi:hypothetical protein